MSLVPPLARLAPPVCFISPALLVSTCQASGRWSVRSERRGWRPHRWGHWMTPWADLIAEPEEQVQGYVDSGFSPTSFAELWAGWVSLVWLRVSLTFFTLMWCDAYGWSDSSRTFVTLYHWSEWKKQKGSAPVVETIVAQHYTKSSCWRNVTKYIDLSTHLLLTKIILHWFWCHPVLKSLVSLLTHFKKRYDINVDTFTGHTVQVPSEVLLLYYLSPQTWSAAAIKLKA